MKQGFTTGFWLIISLLTGLTGWAQSVVIRGKVADQATQQPIGFATVSVWSRDSVSLQGTTTDEQGAFSLPLADRNPLLRVQSVSFQTSQQAILIPAGESVLTVPIIYLRPGETTLTEVQVQGWTSCSGCPRSRLTPKEPSIYAVTKTFGSLSMASPPLALRRTYSLNYRLTKSTRWK